MKEPQRQARFKLFALKEWLKFFQNPVNGKKSVCLALAKSFEWKSKAKQRPVLAVC